MAAVSSKLAQNFRRNVRALMAEQGLTQSDLAEKLKVTASFISQMLSGHRNPGLESLCEFSRALGVQPAELLENNSAKSA